MDGFYYTSDKVIKGFPFEMPSVTSGVGVKLFNAMVQHNDKVAQIYVETGESLKYGELLKRCIRTAIEMKNRGVSPTDIVLMIVDSSSTDFCVPFIASLFLSATASYLPEDVTLDDIVHVLRLLQPTMLFTSLTFLDIVENAVKLVKIQSTIVVLGSTTKHVPFELFVQMKSNEACFTPTEPDDIKDTAYICFTSGSTGMMKAACVSDYRMSVLSQHFINVGVISPVFMYHACLFWDIDGVLLIGSILSGYTSVIVKGFQNHSNMLWAIIEKYKVTTIFGSPIEIHTLFNSDCQRQLNITSLSTIISVGSSLSRSTILRFKSILPLTDLIQMYGQTELATVTLFRPGNAEDKALANLKPESCGRPAMGVQIKVVDSDGSALGFNQIGEFRVRTPLIMNGYYNSDVDLSHLLDPDGWFKTGDLGYYDEDFCFFYYWSNKGFNQMWRYSYFSF